MKERTKNIFNNLGRYALVGALFIVLAFSIVVLPFFSSQKTASAALNTTEDLSLSDDYTLSFSPTDRNFEITIDTIFNGALPFNAFECYAYNPSNGSTVAFLFSFFVNSGNISFTLSVDRFDNVNMTNSSETFALGGIPYTTNANGYRRITISFRRNNSQLIGFVKYNDQFINRTPSLAFFDNLFAPVGNGFFSLRFRNSALETIDLTTLPDYVAVSRFSNYVSFDANFQSWHNHNQLSYDNGFIDGANATNTAVVGVFPAIIGSIVGFFSTIGSYQIMGISLLGIGITIGSILLVLALLRVFLK